MNTATKQLCRRHLIDCVPVRTVFWHQADTVGIELVSAKPQLTVYRCQRCTRYQVPNVFSKASRYMNSNCMRYVQYKCTSDPEIRIDVQDSQVACPMCWRRHLKFKQARDRRCVWTDAIVALARFFKPNL